MPAAPAMASLSPGVLLRLLQDMDSTFFGGTGSPRRPPLHGSPAVLQITGIVPALAGPDLRPDHGFFVKVSDASHSTFVSLAADLNDLILADRLQIGQLISVRRLDPASPVPLLRDFRLLSGRQPCPLDTVDLTRKPRASAPVSSMPPLPLPEMKKRQLHSRSNSFTGEHAATSPNPAFTASPLQRAVKKREAKRRSSDVLNDLKNMSFAGADEDSYDSDDSRLSFTSSSSSSPFAQRPRKNWDSGGGRTTERRKETKALSRPLSAKTSPNRLSQVGSLMAKSRKLHGSSPKRKLTDSDSTCTGSSLDKMDVAWTTTLSPNLMKHAKEVARQRDSALQAAIDSLLEASAAEQLIECLSVYSELQSNKDCDPQLMVNRFLNFHQKLAQTRLIAQSLSKSSQQSPNNCNPKNAAPYRSAVKVASERKSYATQWVKAALQSELSQFPLQLKSSFAREAPETPPALATMLSSAVHKPKNGISKGSTLLLASSALQCEFNRWFLRYIDKLLDSLQSESAYRGCELEVASLLCQLKRVDEWLNNITCKDRVRSDGTSSEDDEMEACEKVRRKIYSILLRHVESAAFALESMSSPNHGKDKELMLTS